MFELKNNATHSQEYINEARSFWWNLDYLQLISRRFNLDRVESVLDIGCGAGHWAFALKSLLPLKCCFTLIDAEKKWVETVEEKIKTNNCERITVKQANAYNLPFPDNSFDLVTCQTVLIHVESPQSVIKEMVRVTKPGGRLLLVEPNNNVLGTIENNISTHDSIEMKLLRTEFLLRSHQGKKNLGEGDNTAGDMIPFWLREACLDNIETFTSDKCFVIDSQSSTEEAKITINQFKSYLEREFWVWPKDEARRYYLSGGGTEERFVSIWQQLMESNKLYLQAIDNKSYFSPGGCVLYINTGVKNLSI